MNATEQHEGGPVWAAQQLQAGRALRSKRWFMGSIHPYSDPDRAGQIFYRTGQPVATADAALRGEDAPVTDTHIGPWATYLGKNMHEVWERADLAKRATQGGSTLIDLAFFPSALPIFTVVAVLTKVEAEGDDFAEVIEQVWTHAGQPMVGKALRAFLSSPAMAVPLQMARAGGGPEAREVRVKVLDAIKTLRDGR
jgi:hypothetical protein